MRKSYSNKKTKIQLLKHQHEFVLDTDTRYLGLIAGFGAGKTKSFCMKAIHLASLNIGYTGALLEPIGNMINDVLIPMFEECLHEVGIDYTYKASPLPIFKLRFKTGTTTILLRSGENYRRLAGLNLAFFGVDEVDTIKKETATAMWRMLQSRLRQGKVYQGFCTTTPEGFNWAYDFFVLNAAPDRKVIKAKTRDNIFLPPEFIQSLLDNYPAELIKAYLEGEFVNLTSGTVYYKFDRYLNHSDYTIDDLLNEYAPKKDIYGQSIPLPPLHIGMDFNINKMAAIIHVIDDLGCIAVDEIIGARDTEDIINLIKERYPQFKIMVYPDSSGKSRDTNNASVTDITLLQRAGFGVYFNSTNPPVKDRINSMNMMLCDNNDIRRYRINTKKCKLYTEALEQQVYDKFGQPDKGHDKDHPNDAGGYFITYKFPVRRHKSGSIKMLGV